ncbi:NADP-dependent oxidoreductase [Aestuariicella hydrocarbonica]|uniref:NADP-dependent oxidoreductase n=1 Tax=Pseudomaricurvus hydrocarbonicus TaxID=1470433 RepID=A0A9E5MKQ0_9GAMM|nr:NADP-dependent oxidoreductase [Aestuariicella hydrocarbonica]NHO66864.1 NADP-dependent oxidoreductase [Aestuariicella hydrocarbonica]
MTTVQQVVLARRPNGVLQPEHFSLKATDLPALKEGQFLIRNLFLSLDAGFRQWMNAGASDNYLSEMPLDTPVQSIVLGEVTESLHSDYPIGSLVVGRTAWETHSIADGSDLMTIIQPNENFGPEHYLSALGPSGMTAYFGLMNIGQPKPGDTLLVSAAAGGVGSLVGQIGKILGCRTIGISSSEEKCQWLQSELGYDHVINYKASPGLDQALAEMAPNGVDIYFDNVGGHMLDTTLKHIALNARIILCGAISQYDLTGQHIGIHHLWELVTKRAKAEGFMFSDYVEEYSAAMEVLGHWITAEQLHAPVNITHGLASTAEAFCQMLTGNNLGKSLVKLC